MERLQLLAVVLIVVLAGAALGDLPGLEATPVVTMSPVEDRIPEIRGWRRTTQGWENVATWAHAAPRPTPVGMRIHPIAVGMLQLLLSLGGMIAFAPTGGRRGSVGFVAQTGQTE